MNPSRRGLYAVYIVAAIIVASIAVGLQLSVPLEVEEYVTNGLMLPAFRYGLLFPLAAYGVILSGEYRPIVLVSHFAIFLLALWFGLQMAADIILLYEPLVELMINYPVTTTALAMAVGGALILPCRARRWILPLISAICGLGLGLSVILESPFDEYYGWFTSAGGLGGVAVIVGSIPLGHVARRICSVDAITIVERISGSWLIAASALLAALAMVPQPPLEHEPVPTEIPDDVD